MSNTISLLVIAACVLFSMYFSATETAFNSLSRVRIKNKAEDGDKKAALVLKLLEKYDEMLSTILIGNNLVNIACTSLSTLLFVRLLKDEDLGATVSTVVVTLVLLIFGEISPKSIAKENSEKFAMFAAPLLNVLIWVLLPFNWIFKLWQKLLNLIFKSSEDSGITEQELLTIVDEAEQGGNIDADESELIRSAIEFNDLTAEDILTPRVKVAAAEVHDSLDDIARVFEESGRSRIPVYEENIDTSIGILHEKDFYRLRNRTSLRDMMTAPLCVLPTTRLGVLLKLLQKTQNHMAVVVDEYGGVSGIVTMEDILEELVGEIWDEHDEVVEDIVSLKENSWRVLGSASLDDLREIIPIDESYDSVTVNGWVLELFGHFQKLQDTFDFKNYHITVERVSRRRVEQINIKKQEPVGQ